MKSQKLKTNITLKDFEEIPISIEFEGKTYFLKDFPFALECVKQFAQAMVKQAIEQKNEETSMSQDHF